MLTLMDGDLFKIEGFAGIAHGVNAEGLMCSGIAVEFRERFPEMHEEYLITCKTAPMAGGLFAYKDETDNIWIYNCFSQELAGPNADLKLLKRSLQSMVFHAEINELKCVGLPWIGTGVGDLDREDVLKVFDEVLEPSTVEFVVVNYVPNSNTTKVPTATAATASLDEVESVLREHVLEWKINPRGGKLEDASFNDDVRGWCSCLERVNDYPAHIRKQVEKVVEA